MLGCILNVGTAIKNIITKIKIPAFGEAYILVRGDTINK